MNHALNYKILVAEESSILNYEIEHLIKRDGFSIVENNKRETITNLIETESPDFIITSLAKLTKERFLEHFTKQILLSTNLWGTSDTVIFDNKMKPLKRYQKPYDSNELLNFINNHININLKNN